MDLLSAASVKKHVETGHSEEGSKKSRNDEQHDGHEEKKAKKGSHHKSAEDSNSAKKGSDTKESHHKQYDEEAGHDKKTEDEADESSFHEDGGQKVYDSEHKDAKKHKVRKFEQGKFVDYWSLFLSKQRILLQVSTNRIIRRNETRNPTFSKIIIKVVTIRSLAKEKRNFIQQKR